MSVLVTAMMSREKTAKCSKKKSTFQCQSFLIVSGKMRPTEIPYAPQSYSQLDNK